ncbi:MAG: PLP-dependent aminotransferase family protein [Vallitaleaceae bacterium]|jgi:GntR family transcriptional regulator/MocR family aminotransferase|nr:PLP-dependent aminotransferase family protein [Vallitaleaceae bacterium]
MNIFLDRDSRQSITKQLYTRLKTDILSGLLVGDEKLPSTRSLAKELHISRNVVLEAYDQLLAEGYIYTVDRSGIYITPGVSIAENITNQPSEKSSVIGLQFEDDQGTIDFRTGIPNLSLFPKNKWGSIYKTICQDLPPLHLDYYEPSGCYELRFQLANYLYRVRGVICSANDIIITSGAAQGFNMIATHFSSINPHVIVEDPMSNGITKTLASSNMILHPVPLDHDGLLAHQLPDHIDPSLIFTTPSHQYPTGAVLPINRRIKLINYATTKNAYIVEDDYDSEYRYEGYPIQSMQSLSPERIIYIGTFSKMLFPALRIGYMVLPKALKSAITSIKYIEDLHSPVLEQLSLAKFIESGLLDLHVKNSKKYYAKKCAFVVDVLHGVFDESETAHTDNNTFSNSNNSTSNRKTNDSMITDNMIKRPEIDLVNIPPIEITGHTAGIHLMVRFRDYHVSDDDIVALRNAGVTLYTAEAHTIIKGHYTNAILIGFANLSDDAIQKGIQIIHTHLLSR